jgi:hypothetical protein
MAVIPPNEVKIEDLMEWYQIQQDLTRLKASEILLRNKIFKGLFPNPKEGTNTHKLPDGYELKAVHKINRAVEPGALIVLQDKFKEANIKVDDLIEYKPDLKIKAYRELTKEQAELFDQALIVKDGTPDLKIVLPSSAKAK